MHINNKKIAVCIMTYNRINFLEKTINSVLNSQFNNYSIFVFNDNSNDGTFNYLASLEKNKTITAVNNTNTLGQFQNANYILENLKSEYIMILHDDDLIKQNYLKSSFELIEADKEISFIGTGWNIIDEYGNIIQEILYSNFKNKVILSDSDFIYHHIRGLKFPWSGTLIRMDKIKDLRFDYCYRHSADTHFLINLSKGLKIGYIPEILFSYRIHKNQNSNLKTFKVLYSDWLKIFSFYHDYLAEVNNTKENFKVLKRANTKTNFMNLMNAPNYKYYFKILFNYKYFNIFLLEPVNWLKIIYKFLKLLIYH
jgi:glycosyltransferase involved in cell wall biosynthesis